MINIGMDPINSPTQSSTELFIQLNSLREMLYGPMVVVVVWPGFGHQIYMDDSAICFLGLLNCRSIAAAKDYDGPR